MWLYQSLNFSFGLKPLFSYKGGEIILIWSNASPLKLAEFGVSSLSSMVLMSGVRLCAVASAEAMVQAPRAGAAPNHGPRELPTTSACHPPISPQVRADPPTRSQIFRPDPRVLLWFNAVARNRLRMNIRWSNGTGRCSLCPSSICHSPCLSPYCQPWWPGLGYPHLINMRFLLKWRELKVPTVKKKKKAKKFLLHSY